MSRSRPRHPIRWSLLIAVIAVAACAAIGVAVCGHWLGAVAGVNVVAFAHYGFDKFRAVRGGWRVPEVVLLGLALIGGVPGSLLGQLLFRHKVSKRRFMLVFWLISIAQAGVLAWFAYQHLTN